ncbi:MAG: peptidylprolyl isomerase [Bacilli bacterium]
MTKSIKLFTLSAVAMFTLGLSSCNEFNEKGNFVVSFNGADGSAISVTADDIMKRYENTLEGVEAYYNAVYEVVLRYEMNQPVRSAKKDSLVNLAKTKVDDEKNKAQKNAETNKKSYDEELDILLKSHSVKTLAQLQAKFEIEQFKTYLEDDFYDTNLESLLTGTTLTVGGKKVELASYLNDVLPYHVKHILVKTSATNAEYARSAITKDEAVKLSGAVTRLAKENNNETFGTIAKSLPSDDEGSANNYGDLGIMSKNTSFVNEFKLGVYTYDSLFNTQVSAEDKAKLGLTSEAKLAKEKESLTKLGLGEIPYGAALDLSTYASKEKDQNGALVNDNNAAYYPRNIIWNMYFNKHNVSVITPKDVNLETGVLVDNAGYAALPGFKTVAQLGDKEVLCDEKGNPILAVRAGTSDYQGIHFIVVERSALVETTTGDNGSTLKEYYTTLMPGEAKFPKKADGKDKVVYVNYLVDNAQTYLNRSKALKDEIKAADKAIDTKMYQYFFNKTGAAIKDTEMSKKIDQYISSKIEGSAIETDNAYFKTWKEYTDMLGRQENARTRVIPTVCAAKFSDSTDAEFKLGGKCYNVKQ